VSAVETPVTTTNPKTRTVAVAAPHALAVDAAEAAARAGGNALDAALAAAAMLVVVYPHQCSLGGDLTALVRRPDGTVEAILSLGAAAAAVDVDALRAAGSAMPGQGPDPVTVPGVVAGWLAIAGLGAELPLSVPIEAAADLAAAGAPVSPGLVRAIADRAEQVAADPGLAATFTPGGRTLVAGETFAQDALAATLTELAADPRSFYEGAVAQRLVAGLQALGSVLSTGDFASHAAEHTAAIEQTEGDTHWWAAPPPSQGLVALALLDSDSPGDLLTRARAAHRARSRYLGDPRGGEIERDELLRPKRLSGPIPPAHRATGDTVAVTAVDSDGWSVALIQSVYMTFGAGILEPSTGIVMQNRGGAFLLEEGHPGVIAPGRRPPHTLCPLLAEGPGLRLALGCQGGRAQPLILAQVAGGAADPEADPLATLAAPRWVVGDRDLGFTQEAVLAEQRAVVPPTDLDVFVGSEREDSCGHVQLARVTDHGLQAAADPRADGRAAIISFTQDGTPA
jgi:gamma-glutamyltranspeptidase